MRRNELEELLKDAVESKLVSNAEEMLECFRGIDGLNTSDIRTRDELCSTLHRRARLRLPITELAEALEKNPKAEIFECIDNISPVYCFPIENKEELMNILLAGGKENEE